MNLKTKELKELVKKFDCIKPPRKLPVFFWIIINGSKTLELNISNLEESIQAEIDFVNYETDFEKFAGKYKLDFISFKNIVNNSKTDCISLEVNKSDDTIKLNGMILNYTYADDMPERVYSISNTIAVNPLHNMPYFSDAYNFCADYISLDDSRKVMHGVYIDSVNQCFVATDGKALGIYNADISTYFLPAIIPLNKFLKSIKSGDNNLYQHIVERDRNSKAFFVYGENWSYCCQSVCGTYPNYKQVIPAETVETLTLTKNHHAEILAFIGMNKQRNDSSVDFIFTGDAMAAKKCIIKIGIQEHILHGDFETSMKRVMFNGEYLKRMFKGEFTEYKNNGSFAPFISHVGNKTTVLMPLRNKE
jgi:DNA polymerase III sliding clamp (beta) subunit (PCNA family)